MRTRPVSYSPGAGGVIESHAFSQANEKGSKLGPWDAPVLLPLGGEPAPDPRGAKQGGVLLGGVRVAGDRWGPVLQQAGRLPGELCKLPYPGGLSTTHPPCPPPCHHPTMKAGRIDPCRAALKTPGSICTELEC